ncbi:MAG: polysaccharide biosynthesis protein, partial [Clostridiales bacterium]
MKQKISIGLLILIDLLIVNLSIIFAYLIKFDFIIPRTYFKAIPILLASASFIKITIFLASRLYKSLWKYAGTKEFVFIGFYILVGNIALIGYGIFYNISVPISIYLIISFLDVVMISSTRIFYRVIRRTLSGHSINSKNLKKVLIYGAGDLGAIVLNELTKKSNSLYKAVVVIDDDRSKQGKKIKGIPIVSGNENLMSVIVKYEIEEVLMAISNIDNTVLSKVYNVCKMQDCKVKIMPAISQLINGNFSINRIREVKIEDLLGRAQINLDNDKVVKFLKNKTVLVTGAGGSIGSELCRQIAIYEPSKLIILDNYENNAFYLYNELLRIHPKLDVKVVIANIRESLRLKRIFKEYNPCVVFHAAAHKHVPLMEANPTEAVKNNVLGTK